MIYKIYQEAFLRHLHPVSQKSHLGARFKSPFECRLFRFSSIIRYELFSYFFFKPHQNTVGSDRYFFGDVGFADKRLCSNTKLKNILLNAFARFLTQREVKISNELYIYSTIEFCINRSGEIIKLYKKDYTKKQWKQFKKEYKDTQRFILYREYRLYYSLILKVIRIFI